jgi:hypothetical protein
MEFLMKPVGLSQLVSRTDHFSIAPGAASKSPLILSFVRIAGRGSHEGQTHRGADSGQGCVPRSHWLVKQMWLNIIANNYDHGLAA